MQIERIDTFPLLHKLTKAYGDANGYKRYRTCFLIRITTKSGVQGWGECIDWLPALEQVFQYRITPYLLGKKATDRLTVVKEASRWNKRAAAGVSMALTDIVAKAAGLSLCNLWGGQQHERLPVYASFQSYIEDEHWMDGSLDLIGKALDRGFAMIKVKIGGRTFEEDRRHLAAVNKTFGDKMKIAVDANQSYDLATALRWEQEFAKVPQMMWFEEPLPPNFVKEYKLLRTKMCVPIAGGENQQGAELFAALLQDQAIDIIQPDIMHESGVDTFRHSLMLSRTFGVRVSPHTFDGALSRLFTLCAMACLPPWSKMKGEAIEPVEWDVMENPFTELFPITLHNGMVTLPDGPGIGVEPDGEILKRYRWDGLQGCD
ncbi:mandelate racemase/muconate lactonizing enzyme family protein [Aneurinibacillus sp. Ricciae_BoGa-3]|uniref:mandelate racemase/muconate lactonizing enzyme family protein n=1 Tax=Aneurinibacillus sp. Ricciae_BoGa-3 TaxID=3022697 RepID=UPI002340EB2A|nr:mandelate racemase/muconate lactonizing enzyme family protein [Aneurinibacillus sp. Ricciae_BoGa-3]WCK56731.1 mandelate racemase/muconate lactonizing enzyme family protein [Aneurinibacillus sp. Ricciae_BoGa-3]